MTIKKDHKQPYMERKQIYGTGEILNKVTKDYHSYTFDGDSVNLLSDRLKTFCFKGLSCVCCGISGSFFAKERHMKSIKIKKGKRTIRREHVTNIDQPFHFNLYAVIAGFEILMTKDHIIPRSLGGKDSLINYQTMCTICNRKKGNGIQNERSEKNT